MFNFTDKLFKLTGDGDPGLVDVEVDLGQILGESCDFPDEAVLLVLQGHESGLLGLGDLLGELSPLDGGDGDTTSGHLYSLLQNKTGPTL